MAKLWILLLLPALPGLADGNTTAATGATATRATPASVSTNVARKPWAGAGPVLIWEVALGDGFGSAVVAGNEVFVLLCRNQRMMRCYDLSPDAKPQPAKVWSVRAPTVIAQEAKSSSATNDSTGSASSPGSRGSAQP